jgi:hypothetical protein
MPSSFRSAVTVDGILIKAFSVAMFEQSLVYVELFLIGLSPREIALGWSTLAKDARLVIYKFFLHSVAFVCTCPDLRRVRKHCPFPNLFIPIVTIHLVSDEIATILDMSVTTEELQIMVHFAGT